MAIGFPIVKGQFLFAICFQYGNGTKGMNIDSAGHLRFVLLHFLCFCKIRRRLGIVLFSAYFTVLISVKHKPAGLRIAFLDSIKDMACSESVMIRKHADCGVDDTAPAFTDRIP